MKYSLIPKTVRLPSYLVDFVEQQPGGDFSKKLVGVLNEYRDGDERRRKMIEQYDEQIEERRSRLLDLVARTNKLTVVSRKVDDLARTIESPE